MDTSTKSNGNSDRKLGDFSLELSKFSKLHEKLDELGSSGFFRLSEKKRTEELHRLLLTLIQETATPCFLLGAINEFIFLINDRKWLDSYSLSKFELWLNLFSGLSAKENYLVRSKIMGKHLPREAYQSLFPIGMGKTYPGSHYVTAHNSPDLDTTIASFWGWVDAFAAKVGEGLHIWNVPGGPPKSQVEIQFLFHNLLGPGCFDHFAKTRNALALSALDLISKDGMSKKTGNTSVRILDEELSQGAIVLVDEIGYYLGDWRPFDAEEVRSVTLLFSGCMRWFAGHFQRHLALLFSEEIVSKEKLEQFTQKMFSLRLEEADPVREFTESQKNLIESYLVKILKVQKGWKSLFDEFWNAMKLLSLPAFEEFRQVVEFFPSSALFDVNGVLIENRSHIFHQLEKIVSSLEKAIQSLRIYVDQLGVCLRIKQDVVGRSQQTVSARAEIEEVRSKMDSFSSVTVTTVDTDGSLFPLGIVKAADISKPILGTVSLRDFCNREETKIPSYFEVISVVDHHKSSLTTSSASTVLIADAQSANALVAELAFSLNDRYSLSGCSVTEVKKQIDQLQGSLKTSQDYRLLQRLLQKHLVGEGLGEYFVDPQRECLEYLQCLYAILDDTDLLSKVSYRDVTCIVSLLNRIKTLFLKQESEVLSLDDIPQDEKFVLKAAKKILQNEDMYSLYKKVYESKEKSVEEHLRLSIKGEPSTIFADTKVQNVCCRVGQTKLFAKNFPFYNLHDHELRALWYVDAKAFYEERQECDLHMHMISTVSGAEDVYAGREEKQLHQDELWIWIPMQEQAIEHLKRFLNAFRFSPSVMQHEMEVEFLGDNAKELDLIFKESFSTVRKTESKEKKLSIPVAVLRYKAGLLNSRKAMISPYLPKLLD